MEKKGLLWYNVYMQREHLLQRAFIITPNCRKDYFLSYRRAYPEDDILLYSLEELESLFLYQYDNRALRYLLEQGKGYHEAKDMLKAIAHIRLNKNYSSPKLQNLQQIAKNLANLGYIYQEAYPFRTFKDRIIVIDGYAEGTYISSVLSDVPNIAVCWYRQDMVKQGYNLVHGFPNIYAELHYVCNLIAKDLASGVKPEDILLAGYSEDYRLTLPLIAEAYGFRVDLPSGVNLYETPFGSDVIAAIEALPGANIDEQDLIGALEQLRNKYGTHESFGKVVSTFLGLHVPALTKEKQLKVFVQALKEIKAPMKHYENAIGLLNEDFIVPGKRIYLLDFNLSNAPRVYQDNDYLTDEEKKELGMLTSMRQSEIAKKRLLRMLRSPNLIDVTYHKRYLNNEKNPSALINLDPKKNPNNPSSPLLLKYGPELDYDYSEDFVKLWGASAIDSFNQYGTTHKLLPFFQQLLGGMARYDNKFVVFPDALNPNGKFHLSASSLDRYFKCAFSYYCSYILEIDDSESSFSARVGTIFHEVLEHCLEVDFNFDIAFDAATAKEETHGAFATKEHVLLDNLKQYLRADVNFVLSHDLVMKKGKQAPAYQREVKLSIPLKGNLSFVGAADKVILTGDGTRDFMSIVDYKSYSKKFREDAMQYGFSLQLPLYAFLFKKIPQYANNEILGLFISPILPTALWGDFDSGKHPDQLYKEGLKLSGLFLDDLDALYTFDPDFETSNVGGYRVSEFVQGMRFSLKTGFASNNTRNKAAVEFARYIAASEKKIYEAADLIRKGTFDIRPTKIKNFEDGCEYCAFRDVCYLRQAQIRYIKL